MVWTDAQNRWDDNNQTKNSALCTSQLLTAPISSKYHPQVYSRGAALVIVLPFRKIATAVHAVVFFMLGFESVIKALSPVPGTANCLPTSFTPL